ncbi:CLUMA_CG004901, isoform A [Clunio marinus]|uniref:CLUMA_CG004901, isoform A n=1 Tax=Clunio marinus TaxID=568069 RepID=A0A1J1HYL2_9DIPT|nr:CLUMA_CG004901, isoform A [Clunio marinus]
MSATDDHPDSDMWMEPDELPKPQYSVVRSESRVVRQYSSSPLIRESNNGFRQIQTPNSYASIDRSDQTQHGEASHSSFDAQNPAPAEQNFFPLFFRNSPAGSSPVRNYQTQNSAASIAGRYSAGRASNFDQSILGSGDFSVVRGGTFFPEGERSFRLKGDNDFYASFLNGHGRPNAQQLTSSKKEAYYPQDPFKNFKDFAEINGGSDPAFSHFIVVYANKNSSQSHPSHPSPKNIFEQLQLLDLEKEKEKENESSDLTDVDQGENEKKLMKLSKFKSKLSKTKVVKKYKKKLGPKYTTSSDYTDPLLALS